MKKIYLLGLAAILTSALAYGQSQRLVLLEHFTGASCPPCATFNPAVNTLLDANPDKIIGLKYQLAPPGFDPMYNHNPQHAGARAGYYQVTGIPNSVLDGNFYNDHPNGWGIAEVNARYAVPSPFEIEISYEISPTEITAEVTVTASEDFNDNDLRLHTVIIEEDITFSEPPGSNGEDVFKNVMKQMLPNQNGTTLPTEWTAGQSESYTLSWEHQNIYTYTELAVIAFVQNNTTREIHQAALENEYTVASQYSLAAQTIELSGQPTATCEGNEMTFTPEVKLLYLGSDELTEADVEFTINGQSYSASWTGTATTLEQIEPDFAPITVVNQGMNAITVEATGLNGSPNELAGPFEAAWDLSSATTVNVVTVTIGLDNWPEETEWDITNPDGAVVASGGPYSGQPYATITVDVSLDDLGCHFFNLYDDFGDGLNASQWGNLADGFAEITDAQGNVILSYDGSTDFSELNAPFEVSEILSVQEQNPYLNGVSLFPNPTSGILNLEFNLTQMQNTSVHIFDVTGKQVLAEGLGTLGEGQYLRSIDLSALSPGLYIINVTTGDAAQAFKVTVTD